MPSELVRLSISRPESFRKIDAEATATPVRHWCSHTLIKVNKRAISTGLVM